MRELERFVILQVVDTRWREHLESMDYLREGIHLRAMAQKDPLVEYRGEGHEMFEELGGAIREEVVLTLFHARSSRRSAEQLDAARAGAERQPLYEHETAAGADAIAAAGAAPAARPRRSPAAGARAAGARRSSTEHKDVGRNDPCWCGCGKKFKKCHGA